MRLHAIALCSSTLPPGERDASPAELPSKNCPTRVKDCLSHENLLPARASSLAIHTHLGNRLQRWGQWRTYAPLVLIAQPFKTSGTVSRYKRPRAPDTQATLR